MIHTIIDLNDIFADTNEPALTTEHTKNGYVEYITVNGNKRLHRLFSTIPKDYLSL